MSNQWLRLWHDMPNDPKWRTIARISGQPIALVQAVYLQLLVDASRNVTRGVTSVTTEDIASALDVTEEQIEAIYSAMQGRVLEGKLLSGWAARQPVREDLGDPKTGAKSSAQRKREQRERDQQKAHSEPCHGMSRNVTTDKDTDTDKKHSHTHARDVRDTPTEPNATSPDKAPFLMTLDWEPEPQGLKARATLAGLLMDRFQKTAIAGFVLHHEAKRLLKTESEWQAALINWVKRDVAQEATTAKAAVVNFPARARQSNSPNFNDISWRTCTEFDL